MNDSDKGFVSREGKNNHSNWNIFIFWPTRPWPNVVVIIFTHGVRLYVCSSVTKTKTHCKVNVGARKTKTRAKTETMCDDNDHLLAVAWWVIFNSLDLYLVIFNMLFVKSHYHLASVLLLIEQSSKKNISVSIVANIWTNPWNQQKVMIFLLLILLDKICYR